MQNKPQKEAILDGQFNIQMEMLSKIKSIINHRKESKKNSHENTNLSLKFKNDAVRKRQRVVLENYKRKEKTV